MNKNDATILDAATEEESAALLKTKYAMTPIATAVVAALSPANPAIAQDADDEDFAIEEIIVTATKRAVALQDVPQSIMAFSQDDIEKMMMQSMEELGRASPSLTLTAYQPGKNIITMRGLATASSEWRTESRVAVYLDEQPVTSISNQLDFRAVDIERIEVLPGPQGTLFGASSQSGAIRYITNKPNFDGVSGSVTGSISSTKGGDPSYNLEAVYNFPLIDDKLAIRVVGYQSRDGGWVDNVIAETPAAQPSWISGRVDNSEFARDNQNTHQVTGGRIAALWKVSDDWQADFSVIAQETQSKGSWSSDDALGDYKVARFHPEFRDDDWWQISATFTGDLGFAQFTSTTSYFERDTAYEFDNIMYNQWQTAYFGITYGTDVLYWAEPGVQYWQGVIDYMTANGASQAEIDYVDYWYLSWYEGYVADAHYNMRYHWEYEWGWYYNFARQERFAQEFRLVSTGDSKLQWMVGAFYEDVYDTWLAGSANDYMTQTIGWMETNALSCYYASLEFGENWNCPIPGNTNVAYINNMKHWIKQTAVFGEVDYSLTDDLVFTAGARWFQYDDDKYQNYEAPAGMIPPGTYAADWYQSSYTSAGKDDGTLFKASLKYTLNDDAMVYLTRSEGFRLGGTNAIKAVNTGRVPEKYQPDTLTNYEIGLKSEWFDNRLRLNVAAYKMTYDDAQVYAAPPLSAEDVEAGLSNPWWLDGYFNLGKAELKGLEISGSWAATRNFGVNFSATFANSEFKEDQWLDPTLKDEDEPYFEAGAAMPNAPKNKMSVGLDYTVPRFMDLNADLYLRYDWFYSGSIYRTVGNWDTWSSWDPQADPNTSPPDVKIPSWETSNVQAALHFDNDLSLTLFVRNVWGDTATSYVSSYIWQYSKYNPWIDFPNPQNIGVMERTLQKPRTITLQLTKKF